MPVPAGSNPGSELFDLDDLQAKLQLSEINTDAGTLAHEWAEAQLEDATGLTSWPYPVPKRLKHWALNLAVIAYNNPALLADEGIDDYRVTYEDQRVIESIRKQAAAAFNTAGQPQYSFPAPDWSWTSVPRSALAD